MPLNYWRRATWPDRLLLLAPLAIAAQLAGADPAIVFALSALALIPLAGKIGQSTEELSAYLGTHAGILLNVTMGNAVEFIIALLAIQHGLFGLVKASITGTIIGNVLAGLGLAFFVGGMRFAEQRFDTRNAGLNSTLLLLGVTAIVVPSAFFYFSPAAPGVRAADAQSLSLLVAVLLLAIYSLSLLFSLKTHSFLFARPTDVKPRWSLPVTVAILAGSTLLAAWVSEIFVSGIAPVAAQWGLGQVFIGAVLVALVGSATEFLLAVRAALRNNLELSITMTIGSSIQTALFVAPLLVLLSAAMGTPMNLVFSLFELLALFASVLIVNEISSDGQTNWFEGALLGVTYLIMAGMFFFVH